MQRQKLLCCGRLKIISAQHFPALQHPGHELGPSRLHRHGRPCKPCQETRQAERAAMNPTRNLQEQYRQQKETLQALQWPGITAQQLRPQAIVLHPNGIVLHYGKDAAPEVPGLWVTMGHGCGWLWFERVATNPACFLSRQWRPAPDPSQGPALSDTSVLWTRQAALEVHQALFASLQ